MSVWSQVRSPSTLLAAQAPSPRAGHRQGSPSPCVAVKQGSCPKDPLRCLSPIQHLCHQDSDCRGSSRCCLGACGRDCRNPVKGMVPVHLGQVLSLSEPQLMISFQLNTLNRIPSQQPGPPCSQNWGSGQSGRGPVRMTEELGSLGSLTNLLCYLDHDPKQLSASVCPCKGGWGVLP